MKSGAETRKRIETLKRISRLQAHLKDLKHARVVAIEHEQARLSDEMTAVFEALANGALAYGAQARFGVRHALKLEQRIEALSAEGRETQGKARQFGLRAKLAEQAAGRALVRYRDQTERRALVDLIDRALARRDASSTQE